jgi:hypothetical protein
MLSQSLTKSSGTKTIGFSIMTFNDMQRSLDEVVIIDLLHPDERTAFRISETVECVLRANDIKVRTFLCSSKNDVFESLKTALNEAHDRSFMLHFTAHGSSDGICNQHTIGTITWDELREPLTKINSALNGDLVVNMIACKGINGVKMDAILTREPPFFGLIGPTQNIQLETARDVCRQFYNKIVNNGEIIAAVTELIDQSNQPLIWAKSAQMLRLQVLGKIESKFI